MYDPLTHPPFKRATKHAGNMLRLNEYDVLLLLALLTLGPRPPRLLDVPSCLC